MALTTLDGRLLDGRVDLVSLELGILWIVNSLGERKLLEMGDINSWRLLTGSEAE